MSQQFEFDPSAYSPTTVAAAPEIPMFEETVEQQKNTWYTRRIRAGLAAGSMVLAALAGGLLTAQPAEAGSLDTMPSPTATFADNAQNIVAAAHRGLEGKYAGRYADEDTVRSCLHAVAAGADACEIDIRLPKPRNGVYKPIVMHDATTNRVTRDCNLEIDRHTYGRLKHCHMNHGDRISSLAQMAQALSPYRDRVSIIAEIKDKHVTTKALRTINNTFVHYGFNETNLAYESFRRKNLLNMEFQAPKVKKLLIKSSNSSPMREASLPAAFDGLIIPLRAYIAGENADPNFSEEYTTNGKEIIPWDVQTVAQMRYVINAGGSGLISDEIGNITGLRAAS
jgi:glycerophosphoryl diester phosphodiesterase